MQIIKQRGVSLIELVVFIVIIGVVATGILASIQISLSLSPITEYNARAVELAQERMAEIIGNRVIYGFASLNDPCVTTPSLIMCTTLPAGYTVSSVITPNWSGNAGLKSITVTVTGLGSASVSSIVSNY